MILVLGLILVGAISALNLVILLVVLRRWSELETSGVAAHGYSSTDLRRSGIQVGDPLPRFSSRALDGAEVTEKSLLGSEALIGFFSRTCNACVEAVPYFARHAEQLRASGGTTIAIVHGIDSADSKLAIMLDSVADIIIPEDIGAALSRRFGAKHYPSYVLYGPDGTVTSVNAGVFALQEELVAPD
ncbi:TlpA family protein disulfide reductase [Streptomyces sp. NPDC048248]|uniref:TlpA family protein disulfide reductase n=1 Tax=Streptomyces sp. NPDC048248 TaxID=3365523 RepID=UPI00370FB94A